MPNEPLEIERATWGLDPDDSPATHHSWRRTQSNTRGSTKKADDDEEPCAGVENATTARRVTGHTTGQQHQDGERGNQEWGLGGKRTLCQTKCKDHHRHGVELRTKCAEGANVETGREQACQSMKQMPGTGNRQQPGASTQHCNPLWTNIEQGQWEEINIRSRAAPATWVAWSGELIRRRSHEEMRRSMKGTTKLSAERERPSEKHGSQTLASPAITMGRSTVERTCLTIAVNSCQNARRTFSSMPGWGGIE